MAQTQAIQDRLLSRVSNGYFGEGFIAESLFPQIAVKEATGKLAKYGQQHLRLVHTKMGGRGQARRVEPIVRSQSSYEIEDHGLEGMVTKADYDNVQDPYDAEKDETMGVTSMLLVDKELVLATAMASTGTFTLTATLSGTAQLSDYANSDPIGKFKTARQAIRTGCGMTPNVAWMDWDTAECLRYHPALLESLGFKANRPGELSDDELARVLRVEKLLIAKCKYNSAVEGQTDALSNIWGKHIWLAHIPAVAQTYQVSAGYYIVKQGQAPRSVFKYNIPNPPGALGIIVKDDYDFFFTNTSAVYLLKDAIA